MGGIVVLLVLILGVGEGAIPFLDRVITAAQPHQGDEFRLQVRVQVRHRGFDLLDGQVLTVIGQDLHGPVVADPEGGQG